MLAQGERSVEELAGEIGQSVANTSQHLQLLLRAGLVRTRRDGARVYYSLAGEAVGATVAGRCARSPAGTWAGSTSWPRPTSATARSWPRSAARSCSSACAPARSSSSTSGPPAEYAAGHLPDAVNVPARRARGAAAPTCRPTSPVVAYCRGPLCAYADDRRAHADARTGGPALRLVDGLPGVGRGRTSGDQRLGLSRW